MGQVRKNALALRIASVVTIFLMLVGGGMLGFPSHASSMKSYNSPAIIGDAAGIYAQLEVTAREHHGNLGILLPAFEQEVTSSFVLLNSNPSFVSALQQSLANYGSITLGSEYNISSSSLNTYFMVNWNNGVDSISEQWLLNVRSDVTAPSPLIYSGPTQYSTSAEGNSFASSSHGSVNWAGYGMYLKGGFLNIYKQAISDNAANTQVVGIEMPPSSQVDSSVDQVATAWIAVSNVWDGSNGLAQTGYLRCATTNSGYNLFYEDYNSGVSSPQPVQYYPNDPTVSPGNILDMTVQASNNNWDFEIYNYNTSTAYTAVVSPSTDTPSFTGYNALYILEAYSNGGTIQQIAKLTSPVRFEGQTFYSDGSVRYATDMYNNSWYNEFTMEQNGNTINVQPSYVMQQGNYQTNIYGYSEDTWQSSVY